MKRQKSTACVLALAAMTAAVPGVVAAGDIYKWTDDNGVVHFGDRPSGADSETVIALSTESGSHRQAPQPARAAGPAPAAIAETAAAPTGPTEEELRAEADKRAEKCATYKERLQKFVTSRRLYREDENGERVYLNEEETLAARAKVQEQVLETCGES
jgi:hypothetical protein